MTCKDKPRGEREADIQQAIRLALGLEPGLVLWRNNVGAAFHAETKRPVQYGVGGTGGADLIGLLTVNVALFCADPDNCDDMPRFICNGHHRRIARFIALEVKRPGGRVRPEQVDFINMVRADGGFAAIVHSVEEARAAIERARRGERE